MSAAYGVPTPSSRLVQAFGSIVMVTGASTIGRYLAQRFRGTPPDERELKRAADALARRGFRWEDVKSALRGYTDSLAEDV